MPLKLKIINPLDFEGWDDMVLSANEYSFFHSSAWAKTLNETYQYRPYYFSLFDKSEMKALIPLMEINSFLTGRRGVSLPFSDWCEPIINEKIMIKDLLNNITDYGKKSGWKYIEYNQPEIPKEEETQQPEDRNPGEVPTLQRGDWCYPGGRLENKVLCNEIQ